jgi:hypothetical protein
MVRDRQPAAHGRTRRTRRRVLLEAVTGLALGAVAVGAIASSTRAFLPTHGYPSIPTVNAIGVKPGTDPAGADNTPAARISSIPVLTYHQMDNGCLPQAARCTAAHFSSDNVTQQQFYDQMSWLHAHGYRTVTAGQYTQWATGRQVMLPAKPVFLTVDDGIANFYAGATPVLQHFGFTMTSMVVSGFAQGAQNGVRANRGWDATWKQLSSLPAGTWDFAFHSGPQGHAVATAPGKAGCQYFYPCQRPGEPAAAYKERVTKDITAGLAAEKSNLGPRFTASMWAVPFNDLAQPHGGPKSGATPASWLTHYAAQAFAVVFVDGLTQQANQHYRYEVKGTDSVARFAHQIQQPDLYTNYPSPATANAPAGGLS